MNNNILQMIAQFKQNPLSLVASQFNIPSNLNDPQAIIQHLLNSNQITQEQVNAAMSMKNDPSLQAMLGGMKW